MRAHFGTVQLRCQLPNEYGKGWQGTPINFRPVRWGQRQYLIAAEECLDFCNAVNAHQEPRRERFGSFLLRDGDWEKPASGRPAVLPAFEKYLLPKPIVAQSVAVQKTRAGGRGSKKSSWRTSRISVDAGSDSGLLRGMELHVLEAGLVDSAKVVQVGRHSAEADLQQYVGSVPDPLPQAGWKVSTRPSYR